MQPAKPACALVGIVATTQPARRIKRSLAARGRRKQEAGAVSEHLRRHAARWWCEYLGRWAGWAGELVSSVLTIGAAGAAAAVVVWSTICSCCTRLAGERRRSCPSSHLQLEREQLSRNGLHSGLENRKLSATMKPDLGGRTARGLQSRHRPLSETNREKFSDLAQPGLDHVGPALGGGGCRNFAFSLICACYTRSRRNKLVNSSPTS